MEANANVVKKRKQVAALAAVCLLFAGCAGEKAPVQGTEKRTPPVSSVQNGKDAEPNVWKLSMGKYDDYPDDYFITWMLPDNDPACGQISGETMEAFNEKLEADGYPFGLKFVTYSAGEMAAELNVETILTELTGSDADIATVCTSGLNQKIAEKVQTAGLMEALDERLVGSALYEAIPELCWECVRYQDSLCYVPNEYWVDDGLHLCIRRGELLDGFQEPFDGNLRELENHLSAETPMFYSSCDFRFAEAFGYAYDYAAGLLVKADGSCVNPLEEEAVVEWLRTINRWYHEGKVRFGYENKARCVLELRFMYPEKGWEDYYTWKGYAYHRMGMPSGILAASDKKDDAFTLLELLHTDHSYGELLVCGKAALETGEPKGRSDLIQSCLGLDTGLRWGGNWNTDYFSDNEEKKQYYEEHILPSPSLYIDFPEECGELKVIENEFMSVETELKGKINPESSILTCDNFDAKLQEFKDALKGPMEKVLGKLSQTS